MKKLAYVAGVLGLALFVALLIRANRQDILQVSLQAGWRSLWLVPYRLVYFLLYALGWLILMRHFDREGRAPFPYLFWLTGVREAIDRLLPVASIGGSFVAVRLMGWRDLGRIPVSVTVICEIILTLWASYLFAVLGFLLALAGPLGTGANQRYWFALLCALPVPLASMLLLRHGKVFGVLQSALGSFVGLSSLSEGAASLDRELRAAFSRYGQLLAAGALEFAALVSASLEIWLAMRWFGHPVSLAEAIILEAATQAVRHVAFFVPAALGIQEAGLVAFGHLLGISPELALSVSIVKRMREILCGIPYLASWQWLEARRLRSPASGALRLR